MKITAQAKEINKTLEEKAPSIFSVLSESGKKAFFPSSGILAQTAQAKGKKFNATIGIALNDEAGPLALDSITNNSKLDPKETLLYSPSYGQKVLRKKWLERIKQNNPSLKTKTSLPVVTNAITHGLSVVGKLFLNEDEKLIVPEHIWGNYKLVFQHAELETYQTFDNGKFNVAGLKERLDSNPGKQVILLNFPNNPTGYSATIDDVNGIVNTIKESADKGNNIVVLCDDAYFGLFFEENVAKESIFSKLSDLHENVLAVKLDGLTKEMYSWGLRVGFVTYSFKGMDDEVATILEDKTAGTIRGNVSNTCTHSQFLAIRALENPGLEEQEKKNFNVLKLRYDEVKSVLTDEKYHECFEPLPFNSGYFMCVQLKGKDGETIRNKLLEKYDTGVIAVGDLLRIAFSSIAKDKLRELFDNIYNACKE